MKEVKITKGTILRTIIALIAIINTGLSMFDKNPIPYSSEQIEMAFTYIIDIITTIIVWWKNNSFTKPAIKADLIMKEEKNEIKAMKEING